MILCQVKLEGKYMEEAEEDKKVAVDKEEETKAEMTTGGPAFRGFVLIISTGTIVLQHSLLIHSTAT